MKTWTVITSFWFFSPLFSDLIIIYTSSTFGDKEGWKRYWLEEDEALQYLSSSVNKFKNQSLHKATGYLLRFLLCFCIVEMYTFSLLILKFIYLHLHMLYGLKLKLFCIALSQKIAIFPG